MTMGGMINMPFGGYPDFSSCISDIKKKNPTYSDEQASAVCAIIEKRHKEKHEMRDIKFNDTRSL